MPGVRAVVDTGLHKVARYDPDRAIDSLEVERISQDAADQRAGRADASVPASSCGCGLRLTGCARIAKRTHRIDISSALLDILAWGGDPQSFDWFDRPSADTIASGLELLGRLAPCRAAA